MKKTLAAAITSALVIGVASTTFAAANPFSDVPRDHWSYDAVTKLAQEGVVEGYGDNSFRGDKAITRYEMAQIVAKAMVKGGSVNAGPETKSLLDRLAAEYADELNNLGVRVSNLEERSDNIKFTGLLRLDGKRTEVGDADAVDSGIAKLRLDIDAKVNADWHVKGRLEGVSNLANGGDVDADHDNRVEGVRAYAEGPLFGATAKLGKFGTFDNDGFTNGGLVIDTEVTGAEFAFGDKLQTTLTYGRLAASNYSASDLKSSNGYVPSGVNEYAAIQFAYDVTDNFKLGAGYFNLKNKGNDNAFGLNEDSNGVWEIGFDYGFNPDLTFGAIYAGSDVDRGVVGYNDDNENSYSVQLTYKGAKSDVVGSYGAWLAYRQLGEFASFNPTFDGVGYGQKGFEIGVDYMIDKNILTKLVYFDGEELDVAGSDASKLFGRVEFQF